MKFFLGERLTFDQLFKLSEPQRVLRADTVRGPPMEISAHSDSIYHTFNFKSFPSTTGLRHHGYIRFLRPNVQNANNVPLQHVPCEVDCTCFRGDAPVLMADGNYKPIASIRPGDFVYSHTGQIRAVLGNVARIPKVDEPVFELKIAGFPAPILATGSHPFYAFRPKVACACGCGKLLSLEREGTCPSQLLERTYLKGHAQSRRIPETVVAAVMEARKQGATHTDLADTFELSKGSVNNILQGRRERAQPAGITACYAWTKVQDFSEREWLLSPWLEEGRGGSLAPGLARFLGYYAAEGSLSARNDANFTLALTEKETLGADLIAIAEELYQQGFGFRIPQSWRKQQGWIWRINSYDKPWHKRPQQCFGLAFHITPDFKQFIRSHVGVGSRTKCFSTWLMSLDNATLRQVLTGLFLGDGHIQARGIVRWTSVSPKLVANVSTILRRLKIDHGIVDCGNGSQAVDITQGDSAREVFDWLAPYLKETSKKRRSVKRGSAGYSRPEGALKVLRSCKQVAYGGEVWDLCVEEDHSFIVAGVAVANCPDYRYRWAWVLKQKGSSKVGPNSMNQALNRAPWKTNPGQRLSLCKHLLSTRDYIYGLLGNFGGTRDTGEVLTQLVRYADRRWQDWQGQSANAKERERWYKDAKAARAAGKEPPPGPPPAYKPWEQARLVAAAAPPERPERPVRAARPERPSAPQLPKAGVPTLAVPPGERGRNLPAATTPAASAALPIPPGKRGRGLPPLGRARRESLDACVDRVNRSRLREDHKLTTESMTNLQEAIKVVEELGQDEFSASANDQALDTVDAPPPSEPPVSDEAVGADTEGNVALQLLTDIKDLLTQLVAAEVGETEEEPEAEDMEGEIPVDALPEPPEDEEDEEDEEEGAPNNAPAPPE